MAEIGWANMFINERRGAILDFTDWYLVEESCFLGRSPEPYVGIYTLLLPLEASVWLLGLASLGAIVAFYAVVSLTDVPPRAKFDSLVLYAICVAFRESHRSTYTMQGNGLR